MILNIRKLLSILLFTGSPTSWDVLVVVILKQLQRSQSNNDIHLGVFILD